MKKVLITGAYGFIGSHVADHLEASGYKVVRSDVTVPMDAHDSWKRADLMRYEDLLELTRGVDGICHIGRIGDVYLASRDPRPAMNVNGLGTLNLLEAATHNGVGRLVYASIWEVYGPTRDEPIDENHPCHPSHPYSISKLAGDLLVQAYGAHDSLSATVLRIGTAYGQGMRETAVISAFARKAIQKESIEIHGSGEQFRQFTHVSDVAAAFRLALSALNPEPVYNIVSPERITIRALAEGIAQRMDVGIVYREARPHDATSQYVSAELARKSLGWTPRVQFRTGLEEFITDYLENSGT